MNQTRITLKGIKHAEFASEETYCYSATVYFDGKRVGTVRNHGHGGADYETVTDRDGWRKMQEFIKTLPDEKVSGAGIAIPFTLKPSLEGICHGLVTQYLVERDAKRLTRGKVAFYMPPWDGRYRSVSTRKHTEQAIRSVIAKDYPNAVIINDLSTDKVVALLSGGFACSGGES